GQWLTHHAATEGAEETHRLKSSAAWRKRLLAATGVLVLGVAAALVWLFLAPPQPERPEFLATLTRATDCVWDGPRRPEPGDRLAAGVLSLRQGVAEIRLANGVDLLLEAPANLEIVDVANSTLHAGRVVVRVPPTAKGYAVDTGTAKVIDMGTEFGVSVDPERETVVQVFAGAVVAELKKPDPSGKRSRRLVAGETARIDPSGTVELQQIAFSHERFLRTFSTPSVHEGDALIPFKPSRISSLDVARAPGRVTVDGDLSEWDLSGMFEARCPEPFAESYYVHGCMMYDEQNLYIAARVGDPMPMRNVIDPNTDPWSAWMGGSVQLRLSTDRALGWPVKAMKPTFRRDGATAQDTSDRIVHLTLWYFQPREQPCLEIRYGMTLARGVVNPPGWQGAFRKAPDGESYTVECAIPWTLLGAGSDPPQTGDELGLSWTVNWSDSSGKRWKGQLIEIKNPPYAARGKKALTFLYAETWGKAVYR
ncbi:MAG: hypothetical protein U9R68_07930, partial [Planctomycetota bacterium]|nr:hypothetical protein [Planctomycetota bacterium]